MNDMKKEKLLIAFSWVWLVGVFALYICLLDHYIVQYLDSDMSSELVLSKLLAEEGSILSRNWYYSAELRVLNTQLVYSFFFRLFQNWHTVRVFSSFTLTLILLGSFYFCCREMGCRRLIPVIASILLVPFSVEYDRFVLKGLFYIPHIVIGYTALGLLLRSVNTHNWVQRLLVYLILTLLAFVSGLGGLRQIVITWLPLFCAFLAMFIQESVSQAKEMTNETLRCFFIGSLSGFLGAIFGYFVNVKILSTRYSYSSYETISWTELSLSRFEDALEDFLTVYGYSAGEAVFSKFSIKNIVCVFLIIALIAGLAILMKSKSGNAKFLAWFIFFTVIIYLAVYTVTDMVLVVRYCIPPAMVLLLVVPATMCLPAKGDHVQNWKMVIGWTVIGGLLINGVIEYPELKKTDKTSDLLDVVNHIDTDKYKTGYATFWNANVLTELSDGKIDMYAWETDAEKLDELDDLYWWLQKKEHHHYPESPLFLLFTTDEYRESPICNNLDPTDIIYQTDSYISFGYDSYYDVLSSIGKID